MDIANLVISNETVTPLKNMLLLDVVKPEEAMTGFGFIVPDKEVGVPMIAKVIKAGPDCKILAGSTILFRRYGVDEVKFTDTNRQEQKLFLLEEEQVLAIVNV